MKTLMTTVLATVALAIPVTPAPAATYVWTNNGGDNAFTNTANWYEDGTVNNPPGAFTTDDNLLVELAGADRAILNAASDGRWLRAGWNAGAQGEIDVVDGAVANMSNSIYLGFDATAAGTLTISGGSLVTSGYITLANNGQATMTMTGGTFQADRMTLGSAASGSGVLNISGDSSFTLDNYLQSNGGSMTIGLSGSDATVQINNNLFAKDISVSNQFNFLLDGANGVGTGIQVTNAIELAAGTQVDVSFLGPVVDGTYTLMTAGGAFTDNTGGNLLSPTSLAAGWTYQIVATGAGNELQVTVPEPASVALLSVGGAMMLNRRRREMSHAARRLGSSAA